MRKFKNYIILACFFAVLGLLFQLSGCASIQHPTGGPRDSVPPKILKEQPKNFSTNFRSDEINIEFDEYFKLANEYKEISVSPAMEKSPIFKVKKKVLNIQFQEPLQDSTTYTINFGNGLTDYNEGNILKNYMYVFSTGTEIDSLSISGTVTNSLTKEPVLDATVLLFQASQDTLFGKKRASLFTSTDSSGNFSLKYLRENVYTIYALKEEGGDKIYNTAKELIGFLDKPIALTKDTAGIKLEIHQEEPVNFRVVDRKIEKDGRIAFAFNKQLTKPSIQILYPAELNATKITEFGEDADSAYVWTQSLDFDSINVAFQDDGKNLDTLTIRRNKRDTYNKVLNITDNIPSQLIKPGTDLTLTLSAPVGAIDGKKFSLLQDSLPVAGLRVSRDSLSTRKIHLKFPWRDEKKYIINIAEAAFTGVFGGTNKAYTREFSKDVEENYGAISAIIAVPDTSKNYIVQVLTEQDKVVHQLAINKNTTINLPLMALGTYYLRVIYDDNKNGKWDTGVVSTRKQPEKVWNFEEELALKANWELEKKITIPKAP